MELKYGHRDIDIEGVDIRIVHCKSALSDSNLESDYSLNPYRGCSHRCYYCYAPFVIKEKEPWGSFVEIRRNIPKVLSKELSKKEKGTVRIGSVTDPYQKVEEYFELTRMCLEQLKRKKFPVIIQTKSDLVTRDIDIFKDMEIDIGLTITSLNDNFKNKYEPNAPDIQNRLDALKKLNESNINTWAFIGPLLPYENDDIESLTELVEKLHSAGVNEIYFDKLNMRKGIWKKLKNILEDEMVKEYRKIFFQKSDYFEIKKRSLEKLGKTVF